MQFLRAFLPQAKMMGVRHLRSLPVTAFFLLLPVVAGAQVPTTKPTTAEAQILLQTRPDLVAQLRQRMLSSGMTPDQIRARLRAEGYPENLLDAYMPGATGAAGTITPSVFQAVQDLGIADSADVAGLQGLNRSGGIRSRQDTSVLLRVDPSLRLDTLRAGAVRDSLVHLLTSRDSGYVIFGLDVFRSPTNQFQPNLSGPVDANYVLGPGDRLVLVLTGDVEAAYSLDVTREGFIVIPQVGQIYVNNLTLGDLESLLYSRLGRVYSGVRRGGGTTHFSLSVARLRSNQVFVVGDVLHPGSYAVSSAGTAFSALYAAAGPSVNGSLRRIEIRRAGRVVDTLDVYDYLLRGDASHDPRLQTGDIVFVPVHGPRARVIGEVVRPATYELKPGEGLPDLLAAAGGFTAEASRRRVLIERIVPADQRAAVGGDRTTIDVSSDVLATGLGPGVPIRNGDVVRVFAIADRVHNRIVVRGNVVTPGPQGLTPDMTLSEALRAARLQPDTYLGEVLVSRLLPDSSRVQLRARLADTTGTVVNDFPLQENDQIEVFSLTTFRPVRYVAATGYVNDPGRYAYREGMTLRDLILLAGGLKEGASLESAEIARLPADRSKGQTAVPIRVPLDSTYLFERRPGVPYAGPPGQQAPTSGAPDVPLEPYDNVLIMRQENFEYQRTVELHGEVRYPGTYALTNRHERLRDLIERAGGLTDESQADAIVFVRKGPSNPVMDLVSGDQVVSITAQDSLTRARATNGRIGIDLPDVMRNPRSRDNIVLEDGDEITIPRYNPVVRVQGAVNAESNVTFVPGRDLYYYIRAAGGGSRLADEDRAYVTQPSGKVESVRGRWILPDAVPVPQAGAVVQVPAKDPNDKRDYAAIANSASQIIASLIAIIALLQK